MSAIGSLTVEDFLDTSLKLEKMRLFKKRNEVYQCVIEIAKKHDNQVKEINLTHMLRLWKNYRIIRQMLDYKSLNRRLRIKLDFNKISQVTQFKKALDHTQQYQHKLIPHFNS